MNTLIIRIIGPKKQPGTSTEVRSNPDVHRSLGVRSPAARSADKLSRRRPPSRPEIRPVRSAGASHRAGATRTSAIQAKNRPGNGKLVAAILGVTAVFGLLIGATTERAENQQSKAPIPTDQIVKASLTPPVFFFDDDADALEQFADKSGNQLPDANVLALAVDNPEATTSHSEDKLSTDPFIRNSVNTLGGVMPESEPGLRPPESPVSVDSPAMEKHATSEQTDRILEEAHSVEAQSSDIPEESLLAKADPAPVDDINASQTPDQPSIQSAPQTSIVTVQSGDTLSGILNRYGVSIDQMPQLLTNPLVKDHLSNLEIGQEFELATLSNGDLKSLSARIGGEQRITIRQINNGLSIESVELPVERVLVSASGIIEQSLYHAAEKANLKQSTIMELADIFQWELDFAKDIRQGDQFSLVYDQLFREGEYVRDGAILAAQFIRGGKTHTAIRFTTEEGKTGYFSPDGKSKQRTFLRHPVDVVRITSRFNPNRLHPVLHQIRAHRGVDYGSPYGSPIYATADGVVKYAGVQNAYGNTVILKHGEKFTTLYAHMSKISGKTKIGEKVKQGDVIGYVGKSGRVTGVHLHYEFRVDGVQMDPLAVELPVAEPLDSRYLEELKALAKGMQDHMRKSRDAAIQVVANGTADGIDGNIVANNEPVAKQAEFK